MTVIKNCDNCRWSLKGLCMIPLYVDANFSPYREVERDEGCYLWEKDENCKENHHDHKQTGTETV